MFLWWRLFSSFADSLQIAEVESILNGLGLLLLWKNYGVRFHIFAQMNYITDVFLDIAIIKLFRTFFQQNTSKVQPQAFCILRHAFSFWFFLCNPQLPLPFTRRNFRNSSAGHFSSFNLNLLDLAIFIDLNFKLAKLSILQQYVHNFFSRFYGHVFSFLCYQVRKLLSLVFAFIFNEFMSNVTVF